MTVQPLRVVDWHELLMELRLAHGMTQHDIAVEVGLHRDTIKTYVTGIARPKHHDGEALIALWMRITSKTREQIPMEQMPISASRAQRH